MDDTLFSITAGALLHDIGKMVYRSGADRRSHPASGADYINKYTGNKEILDCIRYHHGRDISNADIRNDSPAYIVYAADNIASGLDRPEREVEGDQASDRQFDRELPLSSIFNLLNENNGNSVFKPVKLAKKAGVNYPDDGATSRIAADRYSQLLKDISDGLASIRFEPAYLNAILEIFEAHLSFIPSSTMTGRLSDISLYDHSKTTAAVASCIYMYLTCNRVSDFRQRLFTDERQFCGEKAFRMLSCDISGIQKFIYNIPDKGAMKSLRARSFYLEILIEHVMDLLLKKAGLGRANLIYTGGGHAYVLLPNTKETAEAAESTFKTVNRWLSDQFGTSLYLAAAFRECSANDLMNKPAKEAPYQEIFIDLSHRLSQAKLKRYGPEDIRRLNSDGIHGSRERECGVCGATDRITDSEDICGMCKGFVDISNELVRDENILLITNTRLDKFSSLPLPYEDNRECYMHALPESKARECIEAHEDELVGVYGRNRISVGFKYLTKIWMGDYFARSSSREYGAETIATFKEIAGRSGGIKRLAVLRADVDNLGKAFTSGFLRTGEKDPEKRTRYLTLSRTASLSRMLSLFFKLSINSLLDETDKKDSFRLQEPPGKPARSVTIVYSGGDDVFIVGAWNEVIEAAVDIRRAFSRFSGKTLHMSTGIGIYSETYPLHLMAEETAELESQAKQNEGKDSIALFGSELDLKDGRIECRHVYRWEEFEDRVVGEKLRTLRRYFDRTDHTGTALLYKFMHYIRGMDEDSINLARFAYQLGKLQPDRNAPEEKRLLYAEFCKSMYAWFLDKNQRKQLLTAINIMIYMKRTDEEDKEAQADGRQILQF